MIEVVAALIWEGDTFLACQRPAHKARGLLWELPGGKVEPGEAREQALIRECREELGIELRVGQLFMELVHKYPDITVHLWVYHAAVAEGKLCKLEHRDMRFIRPEESGQYAFCPADAVILEKLRRPHAM